MENRISIKSFVVSNQKKAKQDIILNTQKEYLTKIE